MSNVYLALDTVLNKQWAAKEIRQVDDPQQRELIAQSIVTEANMIKRFDHPAIPRIVDIVDEAGVLYVIMDYIEGRTLDAIVEREGARPEDDVVDWAMQLCDVLEYLHQRKPPVIYRDMKPSNVMLKPNGLVELIDFGIAREYREDGSSTSAAVGDTVQLGTRGFAPPEQYGGSDQTDARTDVYALGATMYNLLTGKSPAEPPYTMVPVRQVVPELSPGIERIVAKATQADPADRYQDCAEMAYDLAHYRVQDEAHKRQLRRKWRIFAGLSIASAACLVAGIGFTIAANVALGADFDHWISVGQQSSDQTEAVAAYQRAASIRPGDPTPYEGMIERFKSDSDFTTTEERQFRQTLLPNISELEKSSGWPQLSYDIGKLYWYNYRMGAMTKTSASVTEGQSSRIRAASEWMHQAAEAKDFKDRALAKAYADVADFNSKIVPLINEGSDKGLYKPYYDQLTYLCTALRKEDNDVMRLEVANLTLDALRTYPRKFRADGIAKEKLDTLADSAKSLASTVTPTTDLLDAEKARANAAYDAVKTALNDAYTDVEA